jgi:type IV pilus assembly protein PilQ
MAGKLRRFGRWRSIVGSGLLGVAGLLLTAGGALAVQASNQVLAVGIDRTTASPSVLIETAESVGYRYTVYDSFDPIRVVIDFPGMTVGNVPASTKNLPAPLLELKVTKLDLAAGALTRVEIILAASADYQIVPEGRNFRVIFPARVTTAPPAAPPAAVAAPVPPVVAASAEPAPMPAPVPVPATPPVAAPAARRASLLTQVIATPGQAMLATNGEVARYEQFTLNNPLRLVVDLFSVAPDFKQRAFPATGGFKQIRVGVYADKVRLVFDAEGKVLPEHAIEKQSGGLVVRWGKQLAAAAPAVAAPAVAVAAAAPAGAAVAPAPAPVKRPLAPGGQVAIEGLDFQNRDGRSYVVLSLSAPVQVSQPVQIGNLVRFEVRNATINRGLRRTIDAAAFPSAVSTVTPYIISDSGKPAVRIAVELKGAAPYTLVNEGDVVMLIVEDGPFVEGAPPAVTTKAVAAPPQSAIAAAPGAAQPTGKVVVTPTAPAPQYTGQKISLVFDNADIRSILQLIGDVSGLNILASNDVKGEITLRLIDVPWDQALDLVLDTANLGKIREGNVIRIMPIDKIRERATSTMKLQREEFDEGVLETRAFSVSYSKVDDVKKFLADLSSQRGSIIADGRNKQLIVKDVPLVLAQMADMIRRVDQPERQVMIEARIVEANTSFTRSLGVKWAGDYRDSGQNNGDITSVAVGLGGSFLVPLPVAGVASSGLATGITFGALDGDFNLNLRLSALESSGEGKIISTPRVTTLNGQKALISQGTKIPYTTVSDAGAGTEFENAELKLEVTPEINPDGSVILDVKASNSAIGTIFQSAGGGDAPAIEEKKAETKVLVRNGQTTVIGGIFVESELNSKTGVPLLMDIPLLGGLFRSSTKTKERRELLIFITPRIVQS